MKMIKNLFAATAISISAFAFADTTPVMVSLVTPVQAPSRDMDVKGLRFSLIYGECEEFTGLDLGLVNNTAEEFTGLALGGANFAAGELCGGQVGLFNWNGNDSSAWEDVSKGCQLGLFNYAESFCGLQDGAVNITKGAFTGLQSAFLNSTEDLTGCSCGAYLFLGVNIANGTVRGCQLGLVNYARHMESGIQVGLVNIISEGGFLPVMPIINGSF